MAKKRMKHLMQEEEIEKRRGGIWQQGLDEEESREWNWETEGADFAELSAEEMEQLMQELQEEMEELAMENEMELMQSVRLDMDPEELEQLKKKHRADEMREIVEADMKYLKALFSQLEKERQEAASFSKDSGVSLQLSGVEIPVQVDGRSAAEVASAAPVAQGGNVDVSL